MYASSPRISADHCTSLIALVPLSVIRSTNTSDDGRNTGEYPASARMRSRSARSGRFSFSTTLARYGAATVEEKISRAGSSMALEDPWAGRQYLLRVVLLLQPEELEPARAVVLLPVPMIELERANRAARAAERSRLFEQRA